MRRAGQPISSAARAAGPAARIAEAARRRAWAVLATATALSVLCGIYVAGHFRIDTDTLNLLFRNHTLQRLDRQLDRAFPGLGDRIIVVVDGATPGIAADAAQRLAQHLRTGSGRFAEVYEPGGGAFFRRNGLLYLSLPQLRGVTRRLVDAEPLLGTLARDPSLRGLFDVLGRALDHAKALNPDTTVLGRVLTDLGRTVDGRLGGRFTPMPWSALLSGADTGPLAGTRRILLLTSDAHDRSPAAARGAIATVRATARALGLDAAHGVRVRLTGSVVLTQDQLADVTTGARLSTALALVLITGLLVWGLRSVRLVIATLLTLLMGLTWTTAFAVAAVGPFNLVSVTFAVLFIGLGVDFGIQFCMRYQEELARGGDLPAALPAAARGIGPALALAAAAAAASFYSVVPTAYAGIVDLGVIAGSSMFFALFANLTVLPALLAALRVRRAAIPRPPVPFARLPVRRLARPVAGGAALLGLAALPLLPHAGFDFNLTRLQNPDSKAVRTLRELERESRLSPLAIEALAPNLATAERDARRLRALDSVGRVMTLASYIPPDQTRKLALIADAALLIPPFVLDPGQTRAPPSAAQLCTALSAFRRTLAGHARTGPLAPQAAALGAALARFQAQEGCSPAALLALQRAVMGSLPGRIRDLRLALHPQRVTLGDLPAPLRRRWLTADGRARIEVFSRLDLDRDRALERFVSEVRRILPDAAGTPVLFVEGGHVVVSAFREASWIALAAIGLLLFAVLRRLRDALLTLAPLALAIVLTVAGMVLLGMRFTLANIIVIPLTIGLGVAFGIYVVLRWRAEPDIEAVLRSSTPEGVLFSGLTTLASFGSLAISPDPAMASLGKTLALALALVLAGSLLVLPALLALFGGRGRSATPRPRPPEAATRDRPAPAAPKRTAVPS